MIRLLISWKVVAMLYLSLILFLSCNEVSEKVKTTKDTQLKQPDTHKRISTLPSYLRNHNNVTKKITLLPKNDENWLINFTQHSLMKSPREKGYERIRERKPAEIIYKEYLNDSTIYVKVVGVFTHALYKGLIETSNDTIFLSYSIPDRKSIAMSILKYELKYTIRIKKGKRYTIAMFRER
jgi:hypothetical protein